MTDPLNAEKKVRQPAENRLPNIRQPALQSFNNLTEINFFQFYG